MRRIQQDEGHKYLAIPEEYPISANEAHSTYDTFVKLRDTLIYSDKFYANNAGRSLIVWIKTSWEPTGTIEIRTPNIFRQAIEPTWAQDPILKGTYIKATPDWCEIVLTWRYTLWHKEQFVNISPSITRIHAYIKQIKPDQTVIERAVFDWRRVTPGEITRVTSQWFVDCDLEKWDKLELHVEDQNDDPISPSEREAGSNRWSVEYKDLPYNI